MLGVTFSDFFGVMVLLCFCLTGVWSMAGSLGSHFPVGTLVHDLGSLKESSSQELCGKWKRFECQGPVVTFAKHRYRTCGWMPGSPQQPFALRHLVPATQLAQWSGKF